MALPVHAFDPVKMCCPYDADAPVHDTYAEYLRFIAAKKARRERIAELARVVRDPTNSAPLTELLDLIEEAAS